MKKEPENLLDQRSLYRHVTFKYLSCYLNIFIHNHSITCNALKSSAGFGGNTLHDLLNGKDMRFNCTLRLLVALGEYCTSDEERYKFVMGFIARAMVEIWLLWGLVPKFWMSDVWEKMQEESKNFKNDNS